MTDHTTTASSGREAEAELYVLLRKAGEDRHEAQALIDRHRDEVLRRAELRRLAEETQPAETQPEHCAHCGKTILRVTGTLAVWWVHAPGGNTICHPEQAASSPRATPTAVGARQDGAQP
ncbi:hypothetical protein GCM10010294_25270 [Streptomyces griseoloalbus]|uniref:hypothetical protein n=1 Tax=Streptomyces griseoloalbus TaxID=67303 RepID=UPI001873EA3D|nr:hypothetical protein GCM10010294_25270 [Streptomyces griseoloalbus]